MEFKIAHWSDSHNSPEIAHTLRVLNKLAVNLKIHTGDAVRDTFPDDISDTHLETSLFSIGNHERYKSFAEGFTNPPSQGELYTKFIDPYKGSWGVTTNRTWYSKHFNDENIEYISLDTCAISEAEIKEQTQWLTNTLERCLAAKTKVFLGSHELPTAPKYLKCNYSCDGYFIDSGYYPDNQGRLNWYPLINDLNELVDEYADKGLRVLGWFYGHDHSDGLLVSRTHVKYPHIAVGSTINDRFNNVSRNTNETSIINVYTYNDYYNTLKIERVEGYNAFTGAIKRVTVFDYDTGKVTCQY